MDSVLTYVFLAGLALLGVGFLALLVVAFRTRWWWGLLVLVFPPAAVVFFARHPRPSLVPSLLMFVGLLMAAGPPVVNRLRPIDLGPLERTVGGEMHLTLTGWDRDDYAVLEQKRGAVVLQMANPDVGDPTLAYLTGMERLRELDLNGTRVTDRGLKSLEGLPRLEILRLRDTNVTDAGFRESLGRTAALRQIDLRGTRVSRELAREWMDAKPGRRVLQ